jgi:hypothetical protein
VSGRGLTLVGAAAVIAVVFRHALAGEVFFRRDVHLMWYTQVEAFVRAIHAGEWPLWNPDIGFGQPLWADANTQILYPPTWLGLVIRPWTYYTMFVAAHLLLAATGAHALARALGLGPAAAAAAGLLWMASGPMLSLAEVWNQLAGAAWMPWALAAAVHTLRTGRARSAAGWGVAMAAAIVAGSPEAVLLTGAGALAYATAARPWRVEVRSGWRRIAGATALAALVGLGLSAGQWIPSLAAAREAGRARLSDAAQGYWSVHPAGLAQLFFPLAADALPLRPEAALVLFGGHDALLPSLYLGLASTSLAMAGLIGPRRRAAAWLLAAVLGCLVLALGRHLPVMPFLTAALPPLRAFRYPIKAMPAAALGWALLCGLGVEALRSPAAEAGRRRTTMGALAAAAVLTALAAGGVFALVQWPDVIGSRLLVEGAALAHARMLAPARTALLGATLAGLALVAVVAAGLRSRWKPEVAALAASAVALCDLTAAHVQLAPTAPRALFTARPGILESARPPHDGRLYTYDYFTPGRSLAHLGRTEPFAIARAPREWSVAAATALSMRLSLFPPTAAPFGIAGSFDHDTPGIAPWRSAALLDTLVGLEGTPSHLRLLQLGAVQRVIAWHAGGLEELPLIATADALLPEPVRVSAVAGARPRAWAVGDARFVPADAEALSALLEPAFDPARSVVLAEPGPQVEGGPRFESTVRVLRIGADRVGIDASLSGDGYVVLADAWDPGWAARVDGRDARVLRANFGFRAVAVPAGRHELELRYRPAGLAAGLALTTLTAATLLAFQVRAAKRSRATRPA